MIYKVSVIVEGTKHPGAIMNLEKEPREGDILILDGKEFKITEVVELMPPTGNFAFLHVTCRKI